ncbi:hypothetical protein Tco_0500386 [Tanacetum coccineum]
MENVGLHVADSHTGTHPEDDFTPLETIRRLCSVFGRRSHLGFEGETFEPKRRIIEEVIQPLIPKTLHTTPPNEDYVAPATKSLLDELLEEFRDEILNVNMVDEGADFNPNKDIEELEKLLANNPKPYYMEIHVNSIIINPESFIHTEPMNPLYGIFESYKSSTKVDREMKLPFRYGLKLPFPYPIANEHPNDVYCYFHPHFILSEGMGA